MTRHAGLLWMVGLAVASVGLYHIKYRAQALEDELTAARRALNAEQGAIHVLEAEWAYLNQPDRLAALTAKYLDLQPITPQQIVRIDDLPLRAARVGAPARSGASQ